MMGQNGYLLDTNAVSEPRKDRPDPLAAAVIASVLANSYLSVMTLGELRRGDALKQRRHPEMSSRYAAWIDSVEAVFGERILPVDLATAKLWGELNGAAPKTPPVVDTLLAATAIVHNLTLVTRNVKDFTNFPVRVLNPWKS